jgi:hypothetical protein
MTRRSARIQWVIAGAVVFGVGLPLLALVVWLVERFKG